MEVLLDGRLMDSREAVHDLLAKKLELPEYYGRNLDALFDVLSDCAQNRIIILTHEDVMLSYLGNYGNALIRTLTDAAEQYPHVEFLIRNENN